MDVVWEGYITNDQFFEIDKFDDFMVWLGTWPPGERIDLIIRKHEEKCSSSQRGYYWAVIIKLISDHTGHELDEIHDYLKWRFLRVKDEKMGLEFAQSTESLTTGQREEYHEKCRRWAFVVLDIQIPLPNEVDIGENYVKS